MSRTGLLLASMVLGLLLACGVALAAQISCPNRAGNLCIGTDQSDTMTGRDGTTDVIRGAGGNDTVRALGGDDRLSGQEGDDTLSGGQGDDTYVKLGGNEGESDRIPEGGESGGSDTIDFSGFPGREGPPGRPTAVTAKLNEGRAFGPMMGNLHEIRWPSTVVIENYRGGPRRDDVFGNDARNRLYGNAGSDRLFGRDGSDYLSGGADVDILGGDAGNDTLEGGGGSEYYVYRLDYWGNDTIVDTATSSEPNVLFMGYTQDLTVRLVSSPDAPEVVNESGKGRVNWTGNAVDDVDLGGPTNDDVVGNRSANEIDTGSGNDTVRARLGNDTVSSGPGDDYVDVTDEAGDDTVDCGEDGFPGDNLPDEDTVAADPGDTTTDCETVL